MVDAEALDIAVRRFHRLVELMRRNRNTDFRWKWIGLYREQIAAEYRHVLAREMRSLASL